MDPLQRPAAPREVVRESKTLMSSADAHLALLDAARAFFEAERVWARLG